MKNKFFITFLILFTTMLVLVSSCKKDYPKDIPAWLRNKIIEWKKTEDRFAPICIKEYENDGNIIFTFEWYCSGRAFYDFYGNDICYENIGCSGCCKINGQPVLTGYIETRTIWFCEWIDSNK